MDLLIFNMSSRWKTGKKNEKFCLQFLLPTKRHKFAEKFWAVGKFFRRPLQRWSRKQSPDAYDGGPKDENGKFASWEGGKGFDRADDEKQGCGKGSSQRYFQSSPWNMSPQLNGYVQLPSGQSPALVVRRPPLGTITNTPKRFGPKTTNTLKMLKSVVKTPSNILKRLQGNIRIHLGKAKRLFQGATRNTGGESLAHVLAMESVEMGLLLEPFLQMPGQLKRGVCEDEGEWEEVKVVKRPYRKVEEEVEDLMSPDWREMKEVS